MSSSTLGRSRTSSTTLKRKGNLSMDEDTALSDMHKKVNAKRLVFLGGECVSKTNFYSPENYDTFEWPPPIIVVCAVV